MGMSRRVVLIRKRFVDPTGAKHDYEVEMIEQYRRERHEAGECDLHCPHCDADRERGEESSGG